MQHTSYGLQLIEDSGNLAHKEQGIGEGLSRRQALQQLSRCLTGLPGAAAGRQVEWRADPARGLGGVQHHSHTSLQRLWRGVVAAVPRQGLTV